MRGESRSLEAVPFRRLIDDAVSYVKRHFRAVFLPVAIPMVVVQLIYYSVQSRLMVDQTSLSANMGPWFLAVLGLAIATYVIYGALFVIALEAVDGRRVEVRRSLLFPLRPAVIGTSVLAVALIFVGLLFLVLPGIYVALLFAFMLPVMVTEERFGTEALGRSRSLVGYNPEKKFLDNPKVKIFAIWVVSVAISFGLSFLIQLPMQIAAMSSGFQAALDNEQPTLVVSPWISYPTMALSTLVSVAVQLYMFFALALLYFDVKRRRDAVDLEEAIDEIAGAQP